MYVLVDGSNNIIRGPEVLPNTWTNANGVVHALQTMSDQNRAALGWLQASFVIPPYNPRLQYLETTWQRSGNTMVATVVPHWRSVKILKDEKKKEIDIDRDRQIDMGFYWNGHTFDSDRESRHNVTSMSTAITSGMELPADFAWRSREDVSVPMTATDVLTFAGLLMERINTLYVTSWLLKAEVDELEDPEQIMLYDTSDRWPAVPGLPK